MDTLLDALRLHLLASMPQMFINTLFVFSFLHPQPRKLLTRLAILTLTHSVYTDLLILYIPAYLHLINSLLAMMMLTFIIFNELPHRKKMFFFVGVTIFTVLMDMITASIAMGMGVADLDSLRRERFFTLVSILYPQLILILIVSWFIRKRITFSSLKFMTVNFEEKKSLLKIISLILVQFIALAFLETVKYASDANEQLISTILIYFTIVISLAALVFMLRMLTETRADAIRSTQEVYVDDINNMFATVRGQRHDFLNHVQVIHTMAQMGKYDQLQSYTATLVQETSEVSDIMNHTVPALAAFVKAKTTMALGYGIAFTCELPKEWNVSDSAINMLDIIKLLGNLVDNGFDETMRMPVGQRAVHVSVELDRDAAKLTIANRGQPIDDEMRARIFQAGYTTKGNGHSGLGLAIVQERVGHYRGQLDVKSDEDSGTTTFEIRLPFNERLAI